MKQRGKKKKESKEMWTTSGPLGQYETPQHSNHRSPRRRRQKVHEKILQEIIAENFPKMGKEIAPKSKKTRESQTG